MSVNVQLEHHTPHAAIYATRVRIPPPSTYINMNCSHDEMKGAVLCRHKNLIHVQASRNNMLICICGAKGCYNKINPTSSKQSFLKNKYVRPDCHLVLPL